MKNASILTGGGDSAAAGAVAVGGAGAEAEVEVVASGQALSIVSGWLGMTEEEALQEAGPTAAALAPLPARRQPFLGLGAKYLPHHKAVEMATALDNKLRKRLERGLAARRLADEDEQGEGGTGFGAATGSRGPGSGTTAQDALLGSKRRAAFGAAGGKWTHADAAKREAAGNAGRPDGADDDSDGEEERKGGPISRPGPGAAGAGGSKAAREALLYAPVGAAAKTGKKSKKQRAAVQAG